jgi:hypothetical protein
MASAGGYAPSEEARGEIVAKSAKLRRFSSQPVAEIVQCGEPISPAARFCSPGCLLGIGTAPVPFGDLAVQMRPRRRGPKDRSREAIPARGANLILELAHLSLLLLNAVSGQNLTRLAIPSSRGPRAALWVAAAGSYALWSQRGEAFGGRLRDRNRDSLYSARKTSIGLTDAARRAGR